LSRTRKDSTQNRVLEVVKRDDGTFDLFLDRTFYRSQVSEDWLPEELCVRFVFCGDECEAIVNELNQSGKKTLYF